MSDDNTITIRVAMPGIPEPASRELAEAFRLRSQVGDLPGGQGRVDWAEVFGDELRITVRVEPEALRPECANDCDGVAAICEECVGDAIEEGFERGKSHGREAVKEAITKAVEDAFAEHAE